MFNILRSREKLKVSHIKQEDEITISIWFEFVRTRKDEVLDKNSARMGLGLIRRQT